MDYYELLDNFFCKHAPHKREIVGRLLLQFEGRELELFDKVEDKYGARIIMRPSRDSSRSTSPVEQPRRRSSGGDIFDRLTDTSAYTGAHKYRFNSEGRGLGLAGRDSCPKGRGHHPLLVYSGNTNSKSDVVFRDSSQFLVRA